MLMVHFSVILIDLNAVIPVLCSGLRFSASCNLSYDCVILVILIVIYACFIYTSTISIFTRANC